MTPAELLDRPDVLLGGRVAEELVFGDISTGAQDDLQRLPDAPSTKLVDQLINLCKGLGVQDHARVAAEFV